MQKQKKPILLFNDECGVCRFIAKWVKKSALGESENSGIVVRPIGEDPKELRGLNPHLNIWEAYATIHMLMPDGSMKLGGEAVAEVFRNLPNTKWFAGSFKVRIFGLRPFQTILNVAYDILAYVRPLFGCESCGTPSIWMRPIAWAIKPAKAILGIGQDPSRIRHSTLIPAIGNQFSTVAGNNHSVNGKITK